MERNYKVVVDNKECIIYERANGNCVVAVVSVSSNGLLPIKLGTWE